MKNQVATASALALLFAFVTAHAEYQLKTTLPDGVGFWSYGGVYEATRFGNGDSIDLEGDGSQDIVCERWDNESVRHWRMEVYDGPGISLVWAGNSHSQDEFYPAEFLGFHDVNADGTKEVLYSLQPTGGGSLERFTIAVDWLAMDNAVLWSTYGAVMGIWDVDGDGYDDILVRNSDSGCLQIWGRASSTSGAVDNDHIAGLLGDIACSPVPGNGTARISYVLATGGFVGVRILNARGQMVRTMAAEDQDSGAHGMLWDGTDDSGRSVPSGVYFCRVSVNGKVSVAKLTMVR